MSLAGDLKESGDLMAGDRLDNRWLQYSSSSLPRSQQDWDGCVFVEKTHWGYYCWPRFPLETLRCLLQCLPLHSRRISLNVTSLLFSSRKLLMYAPPEEQPKQSLNREEMTEVGARRERTHTGCAAASQR